MTRLNPAALIAVAIVLGTVACGGSSSPTAPSPTSQNLSVQAIRATPEGVGVQYSTEFQFDAAGTFPTGTQFVWQFGAERPQRPARLEAPTFTRRLGASA